MSDQNLLCFDTMSDHLERLIVCTGQRTQIKEPAEGHAVIDGRAFQYILCGLTYTSIDSHHKTPYRKCVFYLVCLYHS